MVAFFFHLDIGDLIAISRASCSRKAVLKPSNGPKSLFVFVNFIGIVQHLERVDKSRRFNGSDNL